MKKTILILLILLSAACQPAGAATTAAEPYTLTLLHLNDTYRVGGVEDGTRGGFGRVATVVRELQSAGRDVRVTHGGDLLFPSLESQMWQGEQMVEALNYLAALAPVYFVPGNHELDRREPAAIITALKTSAFTWYADNLLSDTGDPDADALVHAGTVFEAGGHRVGLFALTLAPADGGNARDYAPIDGRYADVARESIERLLKDGAEIVFGLTHLHLADDRALAALKSEYPAFALIVGGHDHEPQYDAGNDATAMVMKGASNARAIWRIDISFGRGDPVVDARLIELDESVAEDPGYLPIVDRWREKLLARIPFLPATIGYAAVPMDAREETIRSAESGWGDFIADQMPAAFGEPAADLAFINSGSLRIDDVIANDITFEDIGRTFTYSSYLRRMQIRGADFVALLEAGYRGTGESQGYFPQVSGFRVCVDRSREEGNRIVQLQLPSGDGWRNIDPVADYSLVAPDFLYGGGDGYDFAAAREVSRPGSELRYRVLDAIIRAQASGQKVGKAVDPAAPRIAMPASPGELCF